MSNINFGFGLSIELEYFELKNNGEIHNNLPLYEVVDGVISAIALVEKPAMGMGSVKISENTYVSPLILANTPILRHIGINTYERCYWYFTPEVIKNLRSNYDNKHIKIGH